MSARDLPRKRTVGRVALGVLDPGVAFGVSALPGQQPRLFDDEDNPLIEGVGDSGSGFGTWIRYAMTRPRSSRPSHQRLADTQAIVTAPLLDRL